MKMKNLSCTIQICLLSVISAISASLPSTKSTSTSFDPIFPKCDKKLLKEINLFWSGAGTPTNVLQQISEGEYVVALSSRNLPQDNLLKCFSQSADLCSSSLVFTYTCDNCCCPPTKRTYKIEEKDGVLLNTDGTIYRYTIFAGNDVVAVYFCNNTGVTQGPPAGSIYVNKQSFNDNSTQSTRRSLEGLMDLLGFQFTHNFGSECS